MSDITGINSIDSLISGSWNPYSGQSLALTYSFMTLLPADGDAEDATGYSAMIASQRAAAKDAMATWSAVANVTFTQVSSGGDLQLGTNDQADRSSGYTYFTQSGHAYLFINNQYTENYYFQDGDFGFAVLVHELGHALGLKHPGDYNGIDGTSEGPYLPAATDTMDYSIMSYNESSSWADNFYQYPAAPMLYDIQAIQYLYGANMSYHTGNDTYSFAAYSVPTCIWDAGGTDTLDFSATRQATIIDLNAGGFSSTVPGIYDVSIAYGVTIERAIAGSGGSTIYANGAGNVIIGGIGADTIYEGAGSDTITGGGGSDTVVFYGKWKDFTLSGTSAALTVVGDGTDTLKGITTLEFDDMKVNLSSYTLHNGGSGNDVMTGGSGNEVFTGGAGVDVLKLSGAAANYSLDAAGSAVFVTDLAGNGGYDLLNGVERIQFSDGAIAVDTDGAAGQLYRLYEAMFKRAPDAAGMGYWLDYLDHGGAVEAIATGFVTSKEFTTIYGVNASDTTFVTALYNNVLNRAPDQAGLDFWVNAMHAGYDRAAVLVGFSESAENIAAVAEVIPVGIAYTPWTA